MKAEQINLVINAIRNTTTYEAGNIEFKADDLFERVNVWSPDTSTGTFHAVEIGAMAQAMGFNAYVRYNEEYKRCELSIF